MCANNSRLQVPQSMFGVTSGHVSVCCAGEAIDKNTVLYEKCDVLVPAAIGNVITSENANNLNCQYVVEAANGPTTPNVSL